MDLGTVGSAQVVLRTFFNIAFAWNLSALEQETLLGVGEATCDRWRNGEVIEAIPTDTLERLGYIFGIYASLHSLFRVHERADSWLRRPNTAPMFRGESALQRMLGGQVGDVKMVAEYLDAQLGRH